MAAIIAFALTSVPAWAAPLEDTQSLIPGFIPSISVSAKTDDNVLREGENPISDTMIAADPGVKLVLLSGKHAFQAEYQGNWASYQSNPRENYFDHTAKAQLSLDLGMPYKLNILSDYMLSHEYRGHPGSRYTEEESADKYKQFSTGAEFMMGGWEDLAQLYVMAKDSSRSYTNNNQSARDRSEKTLNLSLYLNVGPRMRVYAGGQSQSFNYKSSDAYVFENSKNVMTSNLDSVDSYYFAGLLWDITGLTKGSIRAGYASKRMLNSQNANYSGVALDFDLRWSPVERTTIVFKLGRRTSESNDIRASYILVNQGGVRVERELTGRLSMSATLEEERDSYSGINREDRYTFGGLALTYEALHWLKASGGFRLDSRNSSDSALNYRANMFTLVLTAEGL